MAPLAKYWGAPLPRINAPDQLRKNGHCTDPTARQFWTPLSYENIIPHNEVNKLKITMRKKSQPQSNSVQGSPQSTPEGTMQQYLGGSICRTIELWVFAWTKTERLIDDNSADRDRECDRIRARWGELLKTALMKGNWLQKFDRGLSHGSGPFRASLAGHSSTCPI